MIVRLCKRAFALALFSLAPVFEAAAQDQPVTFFGLQLGSKVTTFRDNAANGGFTYKGPEAEYQPYPDTWDFDLAAKYFKKRNMIALKTFTGKMNVKAADSYEAVSVDGVLKYTLYFYDDLLFRVDRSFWFENPGDLKKLLDATRQKYGRATEQKQTVDMMNSSVRSMEYVWKLKSMVICLRYKEEYVDSLVEPAAWVPKSARITYFDIKLQNDIVTAQNQYVDQVNRGQKELDTSNL